MATDEELLAVLTQAGLHGKVIRIEDLGQSTVRVSLPMAKATPPLMWHLGELLRSSPGDRQVEVELVNGPSRHVLTLRDSITMTPELRSQLELLLGPEAVR